jgi:outer membrane receptor protein involved in Fe transport
LFAGGATQSLAGTYSNYASALPRWRGLGHLDGDRGPWHVGYSVQWIGSYAECGYVAFSSDQYCRHVAQALYHDMDVVFKVTPLLTLHGGISNLTDRQPPFINIGPDANTDPSVYRTLGRTWFASVRYQLRH